MKIEGYDVMSLVDYPGHVAFVIYTGGCNFDCHYCHNLRLKAGTGIEIMWEAVAAQLELRWGFVDSVVITGGEPTFNFNDREKPYLIDVLQRIKKMGYLVKLDTNGSNPDVLMSLKEEGVIDYFAMDVKTDGNNYGRVTGHVTWTIRENIKSSIECLINGKVPYEFRITAVPSLVNMGNIADIGTLVKGAGLVALQQYRPTERCKEVPYSKDQLQDLAIMLLRYVKKVEVRNL